MKRYIPLLFLSTLMSAESYVDYCLEKYPPKEKPSELRQCLSDFSDFNDSKPSKETSNEKKPLEVKSHMYDFLASDIRRLFSADDLEILDKAYKDFEDSETNKAYAVEVNEKGEIVDAYGYCVARETITEARNCAIDTCAQYRKGNTACLPQYENYEYVLEKNIKTLKNFIANNYQLPKQNNQSFKSKQRTNINWQRGLSYMADQLNNNPAFTGRPVVKICNFKNFEGQIITGDCRNNSINSGGEIYWKVR